MEDWNSVIIGLEVQNYVVTRVSDVYQRLPVGIRDFEIVCVLGHTSIASIEPFPTKEANYSEVMNSSSD